MCQTLFYVLFLPSLLSLSLSLSVCFLCSAAGLDASNQASTHELTIPNDVSTSVTMRKMSWQRFILIQNGRFAIQKLMGRPLFLFKDNIVEALQRYSHSYSADFLIRGHFLLISHRHCQYSVS